MYNVQKDSAMKRVLFIVISALLSVYVSAQSSTNHMTFKGIPIDGSIDEFVSGMKQKGFTFIVVEDGVAFFTGEFAACSPCTIKAVSSNSTNVVSHVSVSFPSCETWPILLDNYSKLKSMLTQKYGKPKDCVEKFESFHSPDDDSSRMYELKFDRCKYWTQWETKKGYIKLNIAHEGVMSCFVVLSYWDKVNTEKVNKSAMDDL
jgi:hypothetical protein